MSSGCNLTRWTEPLISQFSTKSKKVVDCLRLVRLLPWIEHTAADPFLPVDEVLTGAESKALAFER